MGSNGKIFTIIISGIILCLIFVVSAFDSISGYHEASKVFNVYLNGNMVGSISDKKELYDIIDNKQGAIKNKYGVDQVYPPNSLKMVENYSYSTTLNDLNTIYNKIEEIEDFTIKGYEVKVVNEATNKNFSVYVLDKEIFKEAVEKFVLAFIEEDKYNDYINGTQEELTDIGVVYQSMFINEKISIKEQYISVNENIYTNASDLAQDLLFGFDAKMSSYQVKEGDTIESISKDNKLNVQEFLIANPEYASENSLLKVNSNVNITLIDPELTFAYSVYEISEEEEDYEKEVKIDDSKPSTYSEITQAGITGISKITQHYQVVNGEPNNQTIIDDKEIIRDKVNQITTKGKPVVSNNGGGGGGHKFTTYVDTGGSWGWPTESPYVVTSPFAPRWGRNHNGIDISGTGDGSRIHAASGGTVVAVYTACASFKFNNACGGGYGNHVIINHGNNLYTIYGHMTSNIKAYVGQQVVKGTVIGYMGNSGRSYGTHLHFGVSRGYPGRGAFFNPRSLYR